MHALVYLELRYARHVAAAVLRSPLRLALWLPYVASLALLAYLRVAGTHHSPAGAALSPANDSVAGAAYLGTLFLTVAVAAGGRVTTFRNRAEAVLFLGAGLSPRAIAVWLQVRKIAGGWNRTLGGILLVFFLAPHPAGAGMLVRTLLALSLALALEATAGLPAFLVARGRPGTVVRPLAWTLAATAVGAALLAYVSPHAWRTVWPRALDPGAVARAILAGEWSAILALAALLGLSIVAIVLLGSDAIPEIYAATRDPAVARRQPARSRARNRTQQRGARIPPGAAALLWKDWAGFRRRRGAFALWLAQCGFAAACGAGAALASSAARESPIVTLVTGTALLVLSVAPAAAATGLALDLASPLFWLSAAPLRARLAVWTIARAWRAGLALGLAPFAAGVASGNGTLAVLALPSTLSAYWSLQVVAVALYAVFPNAIDARGPLAPLRIIVALAFVAAPLAVAVLATLYGGSPFAATCCASAALLMEAILALEFASRRLQERGASFTTSAGLA